MVSSIGESIYCSEAAEFFTQSLECSLKEALFSLRKSSQTYAALEPAIQQIELLKGQLFRKMYECVRGRPGKISFFFSSDFLCLFLNLLKEKIVFISIVSRRFIGKS